MGNRYLMIRDYIYSFLLIMFSFFLPLFQKYSPLIISLITLIWIVDGIVHMMFVKPRLLQLQIKEYFGNKQRTLLLTFSFYYLLYFAGLVYTENFRYAWFDLEVKLTLLIIPLIFSTFRHQVLNRKVFHAILITFVAGCILATLISYFSAMVSYSRNGNWAEFYYARLSYFIHPGYFAMYLNFAIVIIFYFLFIIGRSVSFATRSLFYFLVLYFILFIVLLSSKTGLVAFFIIVFLTSLYLVFRKRFILKGISLLFITLLFTYVIFKAFPLLENRISNAASAIHSVERIEKTTTEGTAERILVWQVAWDIVMENPLFGVGTGDVKDELVEKYRERGYSNLINLELNAHNQFLQTYISVGLPGLLFLIVMLVVPAFWAVRMEFHIYCLFLVIIAINLLVESVFERQAGNLFYSFFNTGFIFYYLVVFDEKKEADLEQGSLAQSFERDF